jgi:photosystem II stability/assembly factor-like uncharacterized protein
MLPTAAVLCGWLTAVSPAFSKIWIQATNLPANWFAVASSADGIKLVAVATDNGIILTSSDSGNTWTQATNTPKNNWVSVASSADGSKLVAASFLTSPMFTSTDSGNTWMTQNSPLEQWSSVASSADGHELIAVVVI